MNIDELVNELRKMAEWFEAACLPEGTQIVNKAADTIESLFTKLQAANMGSNRNYTIGQIIDAITQDAASIIHYAQYQDRDGLKNELTQYLNAENEQAESCPKRYGEKNDKRELR